jgi:hypothetical protein
MCQKCRIFLHDFLGTGINQTLELAKYTRVKSLRLVLPELVDWIYRVYLRLSKETFQKSRQTASRIAKRNRSPLEYEYVLFTATFNMMRFEVPWLREEILYLEYFLYESGFIQYKKRCFENQAQNYIAYVTTRALIYLYEIHDDHVNPKGIQTPLNTPIILVPDNDQNTLVDKDDYQSAVLEEDDDLYT